MYSLGRKGNATRLSGTPSSRLDLYLALSNATISRMLKMICVLKAHAQDPSGLRLLVPPLLRQQASACTCLGRKKLDG